MKKLNIFFVFIFAFLLFGQAFSQSDYQIVQNFKEKYSELEESIQNADSLSQLLAISEEIDEFADKFVINRELLDKSLYPDDFIGAIEKLRNKLNLRRGDFTQITSLKTQVSNLEQRFEQLNQQNTEFINRVKKLEKQSQDDKSKIVQLQASISELKASMRKRDELVMSMLDSLMPSGFIENGELTLEEKQRVISKAEEINIFSNIKRAVNDNIRFLEITTLKPSDINEIKGQQEEFKRTWQNIGPAIIDIYSEKGENIRNLKAIDSSFAMWNAAINNEAWYSIRQTFTENGIYLKNFSSGSEFTEAVTSYIDDQIKSTAKNEEAVKTFEVFSDSVWNENIKPNWMPFLVENDMLTAGQKDSIETQIKQWEDKVYPGSPTWFYILIAIVIIIIIIFFIRRISARKSTETNHTKG